MRADFILLSQVDVEFAGAEVRAPQKRTHPDSTLDKTNFLQEWSVQQRVANSAGKKKKTKNVEYSHEQKSKMNLKYPQQAWKKQRKGMREKNSELWRNTADERICGQISTTTDFFFFSNKKLNYNKRRGSNQDNYCLVMK